MTEEQIRAAVKEKGKITYGNGTYQLSGKVEGNDLIDFEFRKFNGEKVISHLTSPRARFVKIDAEAGNMRLFFEKVRIVNEDSQFDGLSQDFDLPLPRQTTRK